ncbi:hypothetical protein FQN57_002190 [Myotisia sp. PD_48]|nr:hypothetical protein FQN57_002190 [Myotisia sp. PD_48]
MADPNYYFHATATKGTPTFDCNSQDTTVALNNTRTASIDILSLYYADLLSFGGVGPVSGLSTNIMRQLRGFSAAQQSNPIEQPLQQHPPLQQLSTREDGNEDQTETQDASQFCHVETQSAEPRKKRKRRTIACLQCRNRKVKCDFEYPTCGRCLKGPCPDACAYEYAGSAWHAATASAKNHAAPVGAEASHHHSAAVNAVTSSSPSASSAGQLQPKLASMVTSAPVLQFHAGSTAGELDRDKAQVVPPPGYLGGSISTINSGNGAKEQPNELGNTTISQPQSVVVLGNSAATSPMEAGARKLLVASKKQLVGKENKTRFYGASNVSSLIAEFTDIKPYMEEIRNDYPVLQRVRHDLSMLKEYQPEKPISGELVVDPVFLSGLLPTRATIDSLVDYYFNFAGTTYHILHKTTFYTELHSFRNQPQPVSAAFIIQLLLVLAIAWTAKAPGPLTLSPENEISHIIVTNWIQWCDTWLYASAIKRPNMTILQIRCLLAIAKETNYTQKNQAWPVSGTAIKLAMTAGYHREPDPDARISIFNREMRRRIWYTLVELDLNASFDRGMPPTVQESDFDTSPPLNINDNDLPQSATTYLEAKSLETPTDSSFQAVMARSVGLRLRICAQVNAARILISAHQLSDLDDDIIRQILEIPNWEGAQTGDDTIGKQRILLWRSLIETHLRRSQLCLHSCAGISDLPSSIFNYSWRTCLDIATAMICQHQQLNDKLGRLAWSLPTDIMFQAAITICHNIYQSNRLPASRMIHQVLPSIAESLVTLVENMLPLIEDKFRILEKGMREHCFLCVIIAMVKTKLWPDSAAVYQKQAVDRISSMCYNMLSRHANVVGQRTNSHRVRNLEPSEAAAEMPPLPTRPPTDGVSPISSTGIGIFDALGEWDFLFGDITAGFPEFGAI